MAILFSLSLTFLPGAARAQDTGAVPAAVMPVAPTPATSFGDWPPDSLPTVPMPGDPSALVRAPGPRSESMIDHGLELRVSAPWPAWVQRGWIPLTVSVENREQRPRELALLLGLDYNLRSQSITRSMSLGPGAREELRLCVPSFGPQMASYQVRAREEETPGYVELYSQGAPNWAGPAQHNLLLVGPTLPELGALDRYTAATPYTLWSAATWADLPTGSGALPCWTSLDVVVLDARQGLPPAEALEPLLGWARLGGQLVVAGAPEVPPAIQPWVEERFAWPETLGEGRRYALGMGTLFLAPRADAWAEIDLATRIAELANASDRRSRVPDTDGTAGADLLDISMFGVGNIPRPILALLLVGLAGLLGPVNLLVVWLARRPPLLLFTTPLLAVTSSGGLLVWGLTRDGLEVKVASSSLTVLDQRARRASSVEMRAIYAGQAQEHGLRPAAGTVVLPRFYHEDGSWQITGDEALEISGTRFLPTRQQTQILVLSDRATALGLELVSGAPPRVTNRLGAPVERLILRDADGDYWLGQDIEDGASAPLRGASVQEAAGYINRVGQQTLPMGQPGGDLLTPGGLPPGSYLATLDGQPFRDDLGLTVVDRPGNAAVLGVLEAR